MCAPGVSGGLLIHGYFHFGLDAGPFSLCPGGFRGPGGHLRIFLERCRLVRALSLDSREHRALLGVVAPKPLAVRTVGYGGGVGGHLSTAFQMGGLSLPGGDCCRAVFRPAGGKPRTHGHVCGSRANTRTKSFEYSINFVSLL